MQQIGLAGHPTPFKKQLVCFVAHSRHKTHQLLFKWGGVSCQADAADRQETSTCEGDGEKATFEKPSQNSEKGLP